MTFRAMALSLVIGMLATSALAQQPLTFRLKAGDRNPSACLAADPSMSRPQTVTIAGGVATIRSNGGINDTAKLTSPGIYRTKWSLNGITYDIEINASVSPATASVVEPKLGCRWSGTSG